MAQPDSSDHPIIIAPATVIAPPDAPRVDAPLSPTTTAAEDRREQAQIEEADRKGAGQRTINLIWETTQMKVALSVIWSSLVVATALAVFGKWLGSEDVQLAAIVFLFGVANLVTGFYFGRTNHQRTGGVGGDQAGTR